MNCNKLQRTKKIRQHDLNGLHKLFIVINLNELLHFIKAQLNQAGIFNHFVEHGIFVVKQLGRSGEFANISPIQNHDPDETQSF